MDINSILLLQQEEQLAQLQLDQATGENRSASDQKQTVLLSTQFLTTAMAAAHTVASTASAPPSAPSHNIANVGGSSPAGNYPPPSGDQYPPSSDPTVPNNEQEALWKLQQMYGDMANTPGSLAQKQIFLQYILNLSAAGYLTQGSDCYNFLQQQGLLTNDVLGTMLTQNAALAYFEGYNGQTGNAGALAWLNAEQSAIQSLINGGHDNPILDQMNQLCGQIKGEFTVGSGTGESYFDTQHLNSNGQYYWTDANGNNWIWTPGSPVSPGNSNFIVYNMIANQGLFAAGPDPYWSNFNYNQMQYDYRMQMFNELVSAYKDPSIVLTLFICMAYDNSTETQLTGFSNATNDQTMLTNSYVTPITNLMQQIGSLPTTLPPGATELPAYQLADLLNQSSALIGTMNSSSSYSNSWNTNMYNYFWNTTVTFTAANGKPYTTTLRDVYENIPPGGGAPGSGPFTNNPKGGTEDDFTKALNSLNPGPGTGTPTPPVTQLQGEINAITAAGSLVTQQSKTLGTQASAIANLNDQILKVASAEVNTSTNGGVGAVALISSIVQNQKST